MQDRVSANARAIEASVIFGKAHRLKVALLVLSLAPLLVLVLAVGVVRFFQSLNDGSLSAWRLLVLFAHVFGCVMVLGALYGRGRKPRSSTFARGRAS